MRPYNAICAGLEATAFEKPAGAGPEEPRAEGNSFSHVENAHSFTTEPELHAGWRSSDREGFLDGTVDWDTAVIKVALVSGCTFYAAHKWVPDATGASGVLAATSAALSSKTVTGGVAGSSAITANASNHSLLVFQSSTITGGADDAANAQRLVGWIDTATNLPAVPNGGDISVAWDSGSSRPLPSLGPLQWIDDFLKR